MEAPYLWLLCLSLSVVLTSKSGQDTSSATKKATQFYEAHGPSIFLRLLILFPPLTSVSTNDPTPINRRQSAWPLFDILTPRRITLDSWKRLVSSWYDCQGGTLKTIG